MEKSLRLVIFRSLLLAATVVGSSQAWSQSTYPNKPVRVVVPLAPGGATDIQARLFTQKLSIGLGQTFLVDNRAGAGGLIAFNLIAHQTPPDGYTLLATSATFTNAPALFEKPPFDPVRDFEPISLMSKAPYALIVTPSFPAKSLGEFITWARANPGKLNFAISGQGTIIHLAAVWFAGAAGFKATLVPYKGTGPATQDVMAGQVHATFANVISAAPLLKAGKIRAIAVTTAQRSSVYPDLPAIAEAVADYEVTTWHGWLAPKGTPRAIVNVMNAELSKVLKYPEVVKLLAEDGGIPMGGPPEEFRKLIASEIERWKQLVKDNGIKAED